ncbi:MAG TPA: restriction endonuclease subunit S [Planctomycetaceae bacterium]|nr:restriction endonuclease subunit S [Planctomycetaceae bacterium]
MSFPRHDELKESGVEWLGKVPAHWAIERFKRSTRSCRNGIWGGEATGDITDIKCVRVADFDRDRLVVADSVPTVRSVTASEQKDRILSRGNLLLEKSGGGENQPVGFVVLFDSDEPAVCSNFVAKIELADRMSPSYWRYCHAAAYAIRLNCRSIKQTSGIQNLDQSQYLDEIAPFPPFDEQHAIASFLDRETSKIDTLVSEQRRLVELLKEKRQAVISHAVTKGLDPTVPMKPSGIEWLGDVPEHWEITRMKWVAKMESGHTPDKKIEAYWTNCKIPWVSLNDTKFLKDNDYISETAYFVNELGIINSSARLLPARSVVFSRDATIGRCAITTKEMAVSQHFIAWICGDSIVPEFLLFRLRSMTQELDRLSTGATLKTIGMPDVKTLVTPVPPRAEQSAIVKQLVKRTSQLDILIAEAERAISLLQERRTALISAAVTGKIDVRDFASAGVQP